MSIRTIAICGDGASAAIFLLALCHNAGNPHLRIVMIGAGDAPGDDPAYLADCIRQAMANHKKTDIHKGDVKTLIRDHNAWVVSHTAGPPLIADLVVLATANDQLIENMITSRIARPAQSPASLEVDDKNRVRDVHGQPHLSLFALGTFAAIPEISRQAYAVAGYAREQLGVQDSAARVNSQAGML